MTQIDKLDNFSKSREINFKLYNDEIKFLKEIGKNTEIIPSHCISSFYKYKRELNDKL